MVRKNANEFTSEAASMFEEEDFDKAYTNGLPIGTEETDEQAYLDSVAEENEDEADDEPEGDDGATEEHEEEEQERDDAHHEDAADDGERVAGYKVHPAAALFPLLEGAEFEELVESIRKHGQLVPVLTYRGQLLDGRNRARAVERLQSEGLQIELRTRLWTTSDACECPVAFIMAMNLHRRNLTDDQRAQIAAELVPMLEAEARKRQEASQFQKGQKRNAGGRNQHAGDRRAEPDSAPPSDKAAKNKAKAANSTRGKVASKAKVSTSKAAGAIEIQKHATPEVQKAVKDGDMTQREARRTIKKDKNTKEPKPLDVNVEVPKRWETFKKPFSSAEMPEVRRIVKALIRQEEGQA